MPSKTVADFAQHGPFAKAAFMIHINNDLEALRLIAAHFGLTSHMKVFAGLIFIQSEEGEVLPDMLSIRKRWSDRLKTWIAANASAEEKLYVRGLV